MADLGLGLRRALAKITGAAIVDEKAVKELVKELQRVLITNDVNVKLVFELTKRIERKALEEKQLKGTNPKEHVVKIVYDELVALMGEKHAPELKKQKILLLGLFGSGKTTTISKLAHFYKSRGLSVGVLCADVWRPAAFEQLEQLAVKANAKFYGEKEEKNAARVVERGMKSLGEVDVLIVDSSGRSAFDAELARELKEISNVFASDEKFLVVSADIGQVAGKQAKEFDENIGVTGVIVTKMDGSGKGGGALSAVAASNAKITFIGTGEKMEDLELFDATKFVGGLLGFPDLEALLEKVKKITEEEQLKPEQMLEEKFTIKMFYEQLKAAKKMGPLNKVFGMLGAPDVPKEVLQQSEAKMKEFEVIINSMTKYERENAGVIKKERGRIERIAKGSGTNEKAVRELLSQFEKMEKLITGFKKNRGLRRKLEGMLKRGGLNMPGLPPGMGG
ncbi:signal recognition particle protein [Candidatus Micrarchaeota archaeon]|nr:signal recognition particle protein [Candidatus Micrarchaeota archaeon]